MKWIAQNKPLVVILAVTAIVAWFRLRPASMEPASVEADVLEADRGRQPIASVDALTKLGQVDWELATDMSAGSRPLDLDDPFVPVRNDVGQAEDTDSRAGWPELRLTAIMIGNGTPVAIINDRIVEPGGTIGRVRVRRIDPYAVHFELDGRQMTMKLRND